MGNTPSIEKDSACEKDIEAGRSITTRRDDDSSYDEAIVRVTSTELDDPEKNGRLGATRTVSTSKTNKTTITTEDLQTVIGTPFEVRWTQADPENPMNWSLAKRGWILVVVALQTLLV
jgi:hypothetical protein